MAPFRRYLTCFEAFEVCTFKKTKLFVRVRQLQLCGFCHLKKCNKRHILHYSRAKKYEDTISYLEKITNRALFLIFHQHNFLSILLRRIAFCF